MNYDLDFFIKKAEGIPEHLWCVGLTKCDKHCFLWYCGLFEDGVSEFNLSPELKALFNLTANLVHVNDGYNPSYRQATPKKRVLAYFYDLKSKSAITEIQQVIDNPQWFGKTSNIINLNKTLQLCNTT